MGIEELVRCGHRVKLRQALQAVVEYSIGHAVAGLVDGEDLLREYAPHEVAGDVEERQVAVADRLRREERVQVRHRSIKVGAGPG